MHDLSDVTFTIPVKIDQPDRARNLNLTTRYLKKHLKTNIVICEMSETPEVKQYIDSDVDYSYVHMKTNSQWFHRTMMLNYMAKNAKTPIVVNYDADVILKPEQYAEAAERIRNGYADMVFPYDGNFLDVPTKYIEYFKQSMSTGSFIPHKCRNLRPQGDSVGGAIFWSREKFIHAGMENENFVSWGFEDTERDYRARTLGLRVERTADPLFHMSHQSSPNSATAAHPFYKKNEKEWEKVSQMDYGLLKEYVASWQWVKEFYQWTK